MKCIRSYINAKGIIIGEFIDDKEDENISKLNGGNKNG